jgi:hypothetical protein
MSLATIVFNDLSQQLVDWFGDAELMGNREEFIKFFGEQKNQFEVHQNIWFGKYHLKNVNPNYVIKSFGGVVLSYCGKNLTINQFANMVNKTYVRHQIPEVPIATKIAPDFIKRMNDEAKFEHKCEIIGSIEEFTQWLDDNIDLSPSMFNLDNSTPIHFKYFAESITDYFWSRALSIPGCEPYCKHFKVDPEEEETEEERFRFSQAIRLTDGKLYYVDLYEAVISGVSLMYHKFEENLFE